MDNTTWFRQAPDKPLFPDLLWSRPESKSRAGKLLIVGGNKYSFAAPAQAYAAALAAGVGSVRVAVPDSTKKILGKGFLEAEFAPSTPSGSFARSSLAQILEGADWSDGVLLAGDFGRNSETAIVLDSLIDKYKGQVTIAQDALDYFLAAKSRALQRENTALVINLGKLQKLAKNNRPSTPVLHSMNLQALVTLLNDWTNSSPVSFITKHADNFVVSYGGQSSTTPSSKEDNWQVELAAYVSVWWLQQPNKPLEAITASAWFYLQ